MEKSIDTFIPIKKTTVTSYLIVQGFLLTTGFKELLSKREKLSTNWSVNPTFLETDQHFSLDTNLHSDVAIFNDLIHII